MGDTSQRSKKWSKESMDYVRNTFLDMVNRMGWVPTSTVDFVRREIEEKLEYATYDLDSAKRHYENAEEEFKTALEDYMKHPKLIIGYEDVPGLGRRNVYDSMHNLAKDRYNKWSNRVDSYKKDLAKAKENYDFLQGAVKAIRSKEFKNRVKVEQMAWQLKRLENKKK